MRRIKNTEGGVADPVTGKIVFPEPPAAGTLNPSYINQIQEEIAGAIEDAGYTLDETKTNQLTTAMRKPSRIAAPLTISVDPFAATETPTIFKTLQGAIDSLIGRYIEPGVEVTISTAISALTLLQPLKVPLRYGSQVTIKGPDNGALSVTNDSLTFNYFAPNESPYIEVPAGCGIKLENINLFGRIGSTPNSNSFFKVGAGSYVSIKNARLDSLHGNMLVAEAGGTIEVDGAVCNFVLGPTGTDLMDHQGHFLFARRGGIINAKNVTGLNSAKSSFFSALGGIMTLTSCVADQKGIEARSGGKIHAISTKAIAAGQEGFVARQGGHIDAYSCEGGQESPYRAPYIAFLADGYSTITAVQCTAVATGIGGFWAAWNSSIRCIDCQVTEGVLLGYIAVNGSTVTHNDHLNAGTVGLGGTLFTPAYGTTDADSLSRTGDGDYV